MQELTLRYSFAPPPPFLFEEQVLEAIAYVRKRTDLVREVGDWQTLIDMRHADECLLYVSDFIADGGGIGVTTQLPPALTWDALQARSARTGLLGAAEEWQTWQLQDGREFYVKPSTNDKRWIRPVDAVEENEAVKNCTDSVSDASQFLNLKLRRWRQRNATPTRRRRRGCQSVCASRERAAAVS